MNIQKEDAEILRKNTGNEICDHNSGFAKEYILGGDTGDYICLSCGKAFTEENKTVLEKRVK